MWLLLLALFIGCLCIMFVFSLVRVGKRADEAEDRILETILPNPLDGVATVENISEEDAENRQTRHASLPIPVSKASIGK